MRPRCEDPDECYRCLTSPAAPRFTPKLKFIPRSIFEVCKNSTKLDKPTFEIQIFCSQNQDFKKLSKTARDDLKVFLDEINAERTEVDKFMAEESKDGRTTYDPLAFRESNVLFKIDTEIHRAFSRINRSILNFTDSLGSAYITFTDISGDDTGYGSLNYWYDSILQDAYLLRSRLYLAIDFIYALHLAETSTSIDYLPWKANAGCQFNSVFNISSRNRLIHTRFLDARSPVLMYIIRVDDDIRDRFLKDERIQTHLRDEKRAWEQYLWKLNNSLLSYSDFISNSFKELNLFNKA